MISKNKTTSQADRKHLERVKGLPCSVCKEPALSEAHHIKQNDVYTCVALCADCHRGGFNGIHGQKRIWSVLKMDEISALSVTIQNLLKG